MAYHSPDDNDHSKKVFTVAMVIAAIAFILVSRLLSGVFSEEKEEPEEKGAISQSESL